MSRRPTLRPEARIPTLLLATVLVACGPSAPPLAPGPSKLATRVSEPPPSGEQTE